MIPSSSCAIQVPHDLLDVVTIARRTREHDLGRRIEPRAQLLRELGLVLGDARDHLVVELLHDPEQADPWALCGHHLGPPWSAARYLIASGQGRGGGFSSARATARRGHDRGRRAIHGRPRRSRRRSTAGERRLIAPRDAPGRSAATRRAMSSKPPAALRRRRRRRRAPRRAPGSGCASGMLHRRGPVTSARSCISSGLRSAIPPQATISPKRRPCSTKLSTMRRVPKATDSRSAR